MQTQVAVALLAQPAVSANAEVCASQRRASATPRDGRNGRESDLGGAGGAGAGGGGGTKPASAVTTSWTVGGPAAMLTEPPCPTCGGEEEVGALPGALGPETSLPEAERVQIPASAPVCYRENVEVHSNR